MKLKLFLFAFIGLSFFSLKASDSTLTKKKNILYLLPTNVGGDLWTDMNDYWAEVGYNRLINNKCILGIRIGKIIYSQKTNKSLLSDLDAEKSTGFNFNIEHKTILKKRFYYSTNIFVQQTKTYRTEQINFGSQNFYTNEYYVLRKVYGLVPKVGFIFINKYNFYIDAGIGVGGRYITSRSFNKINKNGNLEKEEFSRKVFDEGNKITQRIVFQIKIGYAF